MAIMTRKLYLQLDNLRSASHSGLPADLARFIRLSTRGINTIAESCTRAEVQEHIDTLRDLISTKVNSR